MSPEVVILFKSTHDVIKAKNELAKIGLACELIPTPKEISSECGMSLRVEESLLSRALALFQATGVRYRDDLL